MFPNSNPIGQSYIKPVAWGVCILGGIVLGNVIESDYFGPVEGLATGLIVGSFVTTMLDIKSLPPVQVQS